MLVRNFERLLTTHKFQKASILGAEGSQFYVGLGTQIDPSNQDDILVTEYRFETYLFSRDQKSFMEDMRVFDIKRNTSNSMQFTMIYEKSKAFTVERFQKNLENQLTKRENNTFKFKFQQALIINNQQILTINNQRDNIELRNLPNSQQKSRLTKAMLLSSKAIPVQKLTYLANYGKITTLHLLSPERALFHFGLRTDGDHHNHELNCLDIESQEIEWQESHCSHTYMMNKIVNTGSTTFLHGCFDRQANTCLRLYDRRIRGVVSNVLRSDDDIWQELASQWTGRGTIRPDFENISKYYKQFQVIGMFSFRSGAFSFPFILDMRRPGTVIPINYPNCQSLSHLKCFELIGGNLIAVERIYAAYRLNESRVTSYTISE